MLRGRSRPHLSRPLAAARPRLSSTEISVDPRTTSRRNFLSLAMGVPPAAGPRRLRQLRPDPGRAPAAAAAAARQRRHLLVPQPASRGEGIRRPRVEPVQRGEPEHPDQGARRSRTTPTRRRSRRRIGAGQAPDDHLGLGRRRPEELRRRQPGRGPHRLVRRRTPAVKDRLFPSSFGAATVDGKIYAMPAETVQPIVLYYNKKVFDKVGVAAAAVVGRHHGPGAEVQRRRASRRSRSAASRAGPT